MGDFNQDIEMQIYKNYFDRWDRWKNLEDQDFCHSKSDSQMTKINELRNDTTYILVVTTIEPLQTASISLTVYGPANVTFERFSE